MAQSMYFTLGFKTEKEQNPHICDKTGHSNSSFPLTRLIATAWLLHAPQIATIPNKSTPERHNLPYNKSLPLPRPLGHPDKFVQRACMRRVRVCVCQRAGVSSVSATSTTLTWRTKEGTQTHRTTHVKTVTENRWSSDTHYFNYPLV